MKISYRREIRHNYLIIDPEELEWSGYECQMMAENQIDGILHFQLRQMDEGVRFYYEITSRQPLTRLLENRKIRAAELRKLVVGIASVLERMEAYLLREERVLLEPDYLYVEPETFRIFLCLIPGLQRDFAEDFGRLLEYLLGSVDHHDKESVILVYGMYQETRKENYGIGDIVRLLYQEQSRTGKELEANKNLSMKYTEDQPQLIQLFDNGAFPEQDMIENEKLRMNKKLTFEKQENIAEKSLEHYSAGFLEKSLDKKPDVKLDKKLNERLNEKLNEKMNEKTNKKPDKKLDKKLDQKESWWLSVKKWVQRKFQKKEAEPVKQTWEAMFQNAYEIREEEESDRENNNQLSALPQYMTTECHFSEPAAGVGHQGTSLLADFSKKNNDHILRALDAGEEDIPIAYYPFIIGKQENLVDYILNKDTVSRLHIRIDRIDGQYQVHDLNSTNGTMVRGRLLDNNESTEIREGDELSIAQYRFRFE